MQHFSSFFIYRPIAATLIMIGIILSGILGYRLLPVSPLPEIDFPVIVVYANVAGASPEVMAATVATPLERSLGTISGINEITSTSSLGSTRIILVFDLDRDINSAANDVQSALNATRPNLPTEMRTNPHYRKVNPASSPIMVLSLQSENMTQGQLYDLANNVLLQHVMQIPGVGDVTVGGSSSQAVKVELNPEQVAKQSVTLSSIISALSNSNTNLAQGSIEGEDLRYQIQSDNAVTHAKDFLPLVVSYKNGAAVRLRDIANVYDTVEDTHNTGLANNKPAILLIIRKAPKANIIETADRIQQAIPKLLTLVPKSVTINTMVDRTPGIRASLNEVKVSLAISLSLVVLVVFLFLKRWRTTLIPSIVIPVSLIGTFGIMYLAGFSLNNLSLMALTIATGFVVDDAIVVIENISRHIEEGAKPIVAAIKGAKEIGFTVLSMSVSLLAVFVPFLAMHSLAGRFFREFAFTLSIAITISMLISLTITPMMCARTLRSHDKKPEQKENVILRGLTIFLDYIEKTYAKALQWALNHSRLMLAVLFGAIGLTIYLFISLPKGLFPEQDTGVVRASLYVDQSNAFESTKQKMYTAMQIIQKDKDVQRVSGYLSNNRARMFITLKPLGIRTDPMQTITSRLRQKTANIGGASMLFTPVQDVRAGGREAFATYQYTLFSDSSKELNHWTPKLTEALAELPELKDVNSDLANRGYEAQIKYDRDTMSRLGITIKSVNSALYSSFGSRNVGTIYDSLSNRSILIGLPENMAQNSSALEHIYITNINGEPIPLSAFASWENGKSPTQINHQSGTAAATIAFNLAPNIAISQAKALIEQTRIKIGMSDSIRGGMQGTAKLATQSQNDMLYTLIVIFVSIYIILGVLYESFIHPITILSTIPSASLGAVLALKIMGMQFDIIAFIGVLLLTGIVKKNAIMMIDYAITAQRDLNLDAKTAISRACQLRFRPILMTSLATIFGAIPLALGHGAGAELRVPLGVSVVGGLVVSQFLTLFTTPIIFIYFDRLSDKIKSFRKRLKQPKNKSLERTLYE